jgi:hypothetical protein
MEIGVISLIAGLIGFKATDLISLILKHRKTLEGQKLIDFRKMKNEQYSKISEQKLLNKLLIRYYDNQTNINSNSLFYSIEIEGHVIDTLQITKPEWIHNYVDIKPCNNFKIAEKKHLDVIIPIEKVAELISLIEALDWNIWNDLTYCLADMNVGSGSLNASFYADDYYKYKYSIGIILEEAREGIVKAKYDINKVISNNADLLPLRKIFLPSYQRIFDYKNRISAGGVLVLLAMARKDEDDFCFVIQSRSSNVADSQNLLSVIPAAFHQPMVDPYFEINPYYTIHREIFEELFGGKESEKNVLKIRPDWYFTENKPLGWLHDNQDKCTIEYTSFSFSATHGNYDWGVLFAVEDPIFWDMYSSKMEKNWESKGIRLLSTKNREGIHDLIVNSNWSGQGFVSLIEGLIRLNNLFPQKVNMPELQRYSPF